MSNQINELSPDIRDFLLNRNLILSDTITNNGLSGSGAGLGLQANISGISDSVQPSEDIETSGVDYRNSVISRNRYTSIDDMVSATLIDNSFSYNQVDGGYIDENQQLNLGGASTNGLDILTSITSQEGFGLNSSGFYPQNSINTSITGRVLGGVGAINDTPLGIIGGEQLLFALAQKAAFNAQSEILGKVNLQPFSLLRGGEFLKPDYSITVNGTTAGRILNKALDLSGFELPLSKIDSGASIFSEDAGFQMNSLDRNNALLKNTGRGQILRLIDLLERNEYSPAYQNRNGKIAVSNPAEYSPDTSNVELVQDISQGNLTLNEISTFDGSNKIWDPSVKILRDKTILSKTKTLFEDNRELLRGLGINNRNGQEQLGTSQLTTPSSGRLSKGSGILDDNNVFSRSWTSSNSYSKVRDLQKHYGLTGSTRTIRNNVDRSVLGDNGFVKITPYRLATNEPDPDDPKKFMLSIENLAWFDNLENLPEFEIGAGDPITGTKGRIMWFPPYDITFQDTSSVNWDKTNFIGRGEPIYTYNNTERSGQLSFKIIIDHPEYINDKSVNTDRIIASIAAGSSEFSRYFSVNERNRVQEEANQEVQAGNYSETNTAEQIDDLFFYFENDVTELNTNYEDDGLNSDWLDPTIVQEIKNTLDNNDGYVLRLFGYASFPSSPEANKALSDGRIESVKEWLRDNIGEDLTILESVSYGETQSRVYANSSNDDLVIKEQRKVRVEFDYVGSRDSKVLRAAEVEKESVVSDREFKAKIKRRFHRESEYFQKLEEGSPTVYNAISEKIKFFQPAFHSTTPEGFNSRLTFLQQCTRQGPTNDETKANNLAFGPPPVCILRVGDFYNTKIVIENLAFTFEPLVWDLNPEGVGVQPMIANVNISFKFIGGSSLKGPINKLQNAVSFNYFGNTEIYDPRADTIVEVENEVGTEPKYKVSGGTKTLRAILEDENTPETKSANQAPTPDQNALAETSNEQTVIQPSGIDNEAQLSKFELTLVDIDDYSMGENFIGIELSFDNNNQPIKFDGSVDGNLYLRSNNPQTYQLQYFVGKVIARENDNANNNFIIENVNGTGQIVDSTTTNISLDVMIKDGDEFSLFLETILSDSRKGTFVLEWVGTKVKQYYKIP